MKVSIEDCRKWIISIIHENKLKYLFFFWDEFTNYFENVKDATSGFQRLAEISMYEPFSFVIVTHRSSALFAGGNKILDRFEQPIIIDLPENMAFRLTGAALEKNPDQSVRIEWQNIADELYATTNRSRDLIKKRAGINDAELEAVLPIHPYTALMLKYMSSAFKSSGLRSMFDFIKNDRRKNNYEENGSKKDIFSFQSYIKQHGPYDYDPMLTADMLWEYFYVDGHDGLSTQVLSVLDRINQPGVNQLDKNQKRVLKTILLLQALGINVGDSVDVFRPNKENLGNAFEGSSISPMKAVQIADSLVKSHNAATTRLDENAFEAMKPFLMMDYGNPSQPYSFARAPKKAVRSARETIARCIGSQPEEIFFTSCGTEADNWAIKGSAFSDPEKTAAITSAFEHHAVLRSCEAIERLGYPVSYMMPTKDGTITPDILQRYITDKTRLVSVMTVNNEIGSVQPIRELCEIAHINGALFHTDAVQAVGHMPINVAESGVDLLSASAHKFNGPRGVGFLYVRKGTKLISFMDGGAQEQGMRAGTENVAGIVGMAAALQENCKRLAENRNHVSHLESVLLENLRRSGISFSVNGNSNKIPGILSLAFPGFEGEAILHRMDLMGICISTGSACDSKRTEISHVLKAIQLDEKSALGTIRISLEHDNSETDAETIANALIKILQ